LCIIIIIIFNNKIIIFCNVNFLRDYSTNVWFSLFEDKEENYTILLTLLIAQQTSNCQITPVLYDSILSRYEAWYMYQEYRDNK